MKKISNSKESGQFQGLTPFRFFIGSFILLLSGLSYCFPQSAYSQLNWHWEIQDTSPVVSQSDEVFFRATLYNDINSTEIIYGGSASQGWLGSQMSICCSIEPWNQYTIIWGDFRQFKGMILNPGDSFDFLFAHLIPKSGGADVGSYPFLLGVDLQWMNSGIYSRKHSDISPTITVYSSSVVHEPLSSALFIVGIGTLGIRLYYGRRTRTA